MDKEKSNKHLTLFGAYRTLVPSHVIKPTLANDTRFLNSPLQSSPSTPRLLLIVAVHARLDLPPPFRINHTHALHIITNSQPRQSRPILLRRMNVRAHEHPQAAPHAATRYSTASASRHRTPPGNPVSGASPGSMTTAQDLPWPWRRESCRRRAYVHMTLTGLLVEYHWRSSLSAAAGLG
jgi:hypothetical protein